MQQTPRPGFPAARNVHEGKFQDRTLRQFAERKHIDPDKGTSHEGTVDEIPGALTGWAAQVAALEARAEHEATEASRALALASQNDKRARAQRQTAFLKRIGRA